MTQRRIAAVSFGLAAAGVLAAAGFGGWIPGWRRGGAVERIVEAGEYNRRLAGILERPEGCKAPFILRARLNRGDLLRTDSLGLRSRELAAEKKLPRVLCIGDSYTFGY